MELLGRGSDARRRAFLLVALLVLAIPAPGIRADDVGLETRVKAAYVYKLLGFVRWAERVEDPAQLTVCAAAGELLNAALGGLAGRRVADVPIRVRRVPDLAEMEGCRVAVVGSGSTATGSELVALSEQGVLTIGDSPGFAESGGAIGFVRVGETVRFEVNLAAARSAGVSIDSRALRLATTVHGRDPERGARP